MTDEDVLVIGDYVEYALTASLRLDTNMRQIAVDIT
jgi:hypothetical protein